MLCLPCWLVPGVGDPVRILEPPWETNALHAGATGTVTEVQLEGPGALLLVHGFSAKDGTHWQHRFRPNQLQAYITSASQTIELGIAQSDA